MTFSPLMETTRFHDLLLCEGRLSRRQAYRGMASFGVGTAVVSTMAGGALAETTGDHPVFFTWDGGLANR